MTSFVRRLCSVLLTGMLVFPTVAIAEESVFTQEMIARSLVSIGNTQRLHKAIEKARNGETVSMVYLGGSITEGALAQPQPTRCYAYLSAQLFAEKFMPSANQLSYHNAGISGTPSLLGITRCEQDVLSHSPDIVFVEFAVNDSTDATSQMVYESLIRKLLASETQPAVILLFTRLSGGYSAQPHMQQVGKHYDLGMISVGNAITPEIMLNRMKWEDYSTDYAHPTNSGHAFIADMIGYYFDQAASLAPQEYTLPDTAHYGKSLQNLQNVRADDACILSVGSFPFDAVRCYSYNRGWCHAATSGNDPLTLTLTATHLTFAFKQEKDTACGTAEVYIDGVLKASLPGYGENAWGNVVTELVVLNEHAEHTITIRMAEGDETKRFSLLDIGYASDVQ